MAIAATSALLATAAFGADRNDANCFDSGTTDDQTIAGCTAVLKRAKKERRATLALAYLNRGTAHKNNKDFDRSIADFNEAIKLNPDDSDYLRRRGNAFEEQDEYERASKDYDEAIRLDPKNSQAFSDRGWLRAMDLKKYDLGIQDYGESLRLDPEKGSVYYMRALAHEKKGDLASALRDAEDAVRREPADTDIQAAVARLRTAQSTSPEPASPNSDGAKRADRTQASIADLDAQDRATAEVWARLPFSARHVMFVSRKADVFGGYEARPSSVFAPGEKLVSYMEPTGYTWKPLPSETYRFGVTVDWELVAKDGAILAGQKGLLTQEFTSHFKNREFFLSTTMSFDGLDAGDYVLAYTLHDGDSDRTTRVEQPFTIKP